MLTLNFSKTNSAFPMRASNFVNSFSFFLIRFARSWKTQRKKKSQIETFDVELIQVLKKKSSCNCTIFVWIYQRVAHTNTNTNANANRHRIPGLSLFTHRIQFTSFVVPQVSRYSHRQVCHMKKLIFTRR